MSSFHGDTVTTTVNKLIEVCYTYSDFNGCQDKVNFDFTFKTPEGMHFYVYDWKEEILNDLTPEQLKAVFPPITRKNFVVRRSWEGRNQEITFTNNKGQTIKYNHDEVLKVMLPKLNISPNWLKRGYWSQSTNLPTSVRHLGEILSTTEK